MPKSDGTRRSAAGDLAPALFFWAAAACLCLPLAAALITLTEIKVSSFQAAAFLTGTLASFCAGLRACRGQGGSPLRRGLLLGLVLTVCLLTIGFIVDGSKLRAEGILLTAGSSFLGSVPGGLLSSRLKGFSGKRKFRPKSRNAA